ncbi:MAG: beta strand repeat-containing protein [Gemmatimonadales bacterium]
MSKLRLAACLRSIAATVAGAAAMSCGSHGTTEPVVTPHTPVGYTVTASAQAPVAGAAVTITAVLVDSVGQPVAGSGRTVTWSATGAGGSFATPTSATDGTGKAAVQFTTGTTVATYVITATDNTALKGSTPAVASVAGPPSAAHSTLVTTPASLPADGASTAAIALHAADANGNVVHSSAGTAVIASTAGAVSATTDNHDGTYGATLTAPAVAGSAIVSATLAGVAVTAADTVTIVANTATQYMIAPSSTSPVAGSAVTISAQLANVAGTAVAVAGHVVTWHVTGAGGVFGAPTSTTNASGVATVTFTTATTAGLAMISGTDAGALTGSLALTSVAGAATHYNVTASGTTPVAGAAVTVTAQLADANGNLVSLGGQTVTWSVTGESGGAFAPTTSVTSATGAATTTYTTGTSVGTPYTIGAHDAAALAGSVGVTNTAGTPGSLQWSRASRIVVTDTAYSAAAFTGTNQFGRTVAPAVTYVSGGAGAATVSATGLVTPVARGQTMLVATATANVTAKDSVLIAVATAASPVVRTDLTRFDIKSDTTFTITVIADMRSATLLGAATLALTWDPAQLTYVSDADGASGVGATVNVGNAANGTLVLSAASSSGFSGTVELRTVTFHATTTVGRSGALHLLVTDFDAASTFTSLLATTLAITYPLISR